MDEGTPISTRMTNKYAQWDRMIESPLKMAVISAAMMVTRRGPYLSSSMEHDIDPTIAPISCDTLSSETIYASGLSWPNPIYARMTTVFKLDVAVPWLAPAKKSTSSITKKLTINWNGVRS